MTLQERLVSEARDRFLEWDKDATKLKCKPDDLLFFADQIILHTIEQTIKETLEDVIELGHKAEKFHDRETELARGCRQGIAFYRDAISRKATDTQHALRGIMK